MVLFRAARPGLLSAAQSAEFDRIHVVSAWATRQRLVLGQEAVGEKAHEIVAIPLLLERLHLTGALVTIDALGTQTAIAKTILDKGADYLLALKDNWPALAEDVRLFFADPGAARLDTHETTDLDHGRSEVRRHVVCHDIDWLVSDRRDPGEPRFPGLKATIKHMAMNLIRNASGKDSLKTRRKAAAWNHDYLRAIVTQTA